MPQPKTYLLSADIIRIIAIFGAISIHIVHPVYSRPDFLGGVSWWLANLLNTFSRMSIPLFIMLSGYFMLQKQESIKETLLRTITRIGIPLLAWTAIYFWWEWYGLGNSHTISSIISVVFSGGIFNLYFLVIMVGLYLIAPILRAYVQTSSKPGYLVTLSLLTGILFTASQQFITKTNTLSLFTYWFPYVGYFLAGYAIGTARTDKKLLTKSFFLYIIFFIITAIAGYISLTLFSQGNTILSYSVPYFDQYLAPNVVGMSLVAFFLLIKKDWDRLMQFQPLIQTVSKASFGVYLVHGIVIDYLDTKTSLNILQFGDNLWVYLLERYAIVLLVSFVIAWILMKIPVLKKVVGEK